MISRMRACRTHILRTHVLIMAVGPLQDGIKYPFISKVILTDSKELILKLELSYCSYAAIRGR